MAFSEDKINALTEQVIGCAIEAHRNLGPGLLESVYRECLSLELAAHNLHCESEQAVPILYKGHFGSPLSMLDMTQAETLIAQLQRADQVNKTVDPALPLELARARRQTDQA